MHLIGLDILVPFWGILKLSEFEPQKLLINFLGLLNDSLTWEVLFDFLTIKIKFLLKHFASIE